MKRHDLIRHSGTILRVLFIDSIKTQVVDCGGLRMPRWVTTADLKGSEPVSEEQMRTECGIALTPETDLTPEQRRQAHRRYTMIAGILAVLDNDLLRNQMITQAAEENGISRRTVTTYLCSYLRAMDISVLADPVRDPDKTLTRDQKNMRWALNKFFYSHERNSLPTAYTMMLKERYCDPEGKLLPSYPSIHQFRHFYYRTRKLQTFYITRDGIKDYQRNHRPLLGNGVREFASAVGTAMLDATICDIYLVNDAGDLVGRPILVACIDAYSSLCMGYSLLWEGGVYSLRSLMMNVISDKKEWCSRFGISVQSGQWDSDQLPGVMITDMGSEYVSENFVQLSELGVTIVNLPSYRPELKGPVEKFFDLVQSEYKKHLKGKGVIEPDYRERGAHDYRRDACLRMQDFEKIVIYCILYYNSGRVIENVLMTEEMTEAGVRPYADSLFDFGKGISGANLISVTKEELALTLLPRTTGRFARNGLIVNKLRYQADGYTERYLKGGKVTAAYNPDDVTAVWLYEGGRYEQFDLIEERFSGRSVGQVDDLIRSQKTAIRSFLTETDQAKIDLAGHIRTIGQSRSGTSDTHVNGVRERRQKERRRTHSDMMKGGVKHE